MGLQDMGFFLLLPHPFCAVKECEWGSHRIYSPVDGAAHPTYLYQKEQFRGSATLES